MATVTKRRILVSGAGIAGCCLAWWLERDGNAVTLVERAGEPRKGGYVIDFWGLGYEVAERMGLLPELRRQDLAVEEFRVVDRNGRKVSGIDQGAIQKMTGGRVMSLQRSALALALYESIKGRVDVRFGESLTGIEQSNNGVDVRFEKGEGERFDLVVGADGLHSNVRRLAFGESQGLEQLLG
jgi:2-polyprenyl-6-methoxyphenol hydroxylase-like FAD-dependent oxidoreductase